MRCLPCLRFAMHSHCNAPLECDCPKCQGMCKCDGARLRMDDNAEKRITIRQGDLHGLRAWFVYMDNNHIGWVLRETMGRKWANVPKDQDSYDQIEYWFDTRALAIAALRKTTEEAA